MPLTEKQTAELIEMLDNRYFNRLSLWIEKVPVEDLVFDNQPLSGKYRGMSLLYILAAIDELILVQKIVHLGGDYVDAMKEGPALGETPLFRAAVTTSNNTVNFLAFKIVETHGQEELNKPMQAGTYRGITPLAGAIFFDKQTTAEILKGYGATSPFSASVVPAQEPLAPPVTIPERRRPRALPASAPNTATFTSPPPPQRPSHDSVRQDLLQQLQQLQQRSIYCHQLSLEELDLAITEKTDDYLGKARAALTCESELHALQRYRAQLQASAPTAIPELNTPLATVFVPPSQVAQSTTDSCSSAAGLTTHGVFANPASVPLVPPPSPAKRKDSIGDPSPRASKAPRSDKQHTPGKPTDNDRVALGVDDADFVFMLNTFIDGNTADSGRDVLRSYSGGSGDISFPLPSP